MSEYLLYIDNGNGTATITGWDTDLGGPISEITTLEIPVTVNGLTVISIGNNAFRGYYALTSLTIGNSVESIGNGAFAECNALTSLIISNSVTSIGAYAFGECSLLASVTIGNSVESIGDQAFSDCIALTSATFNGDAPVIFGNGVFEFTSSSFLIKYYDGTTGWTNPWNGYDTECIDCEESSPTEEPTITSIPDQTGGGISHTKSAKTSRTTLIAPISRPLQSGQIISNINRGPRGPWNT